MIDHILTKISSKWLLS